ncbi:MAG TPA: T9SS type A sorting domain-containing protein [Bacteroidales bacterium]|nr:T9SS type A sorting domain-containing protein [Bacteroidales bacterium]
MSLLLSFSVPAIHLLGQTSGAAGVDIPLQMNHSPLFGLDTYLNNQPLQDQRNVVVCSAFNGWLYAAYSYFNHTNFEAAFTVLRSKDSGVNWSIIINGTLGQAHTTFTKLDIKACGMDTVNLKVFVGFCVFDSVNLWHTALVVRYNGNTGHVEDNILYDEDSWDIRDLALASDDLYPAGGSAPYSIAVIYSKWNVHDSIIVRTSGNGGMSFTKRYRIAGSSHYFNKVALAYGRSPSFPAGRYFAAWEEKDNANSVSGHIYTAHSEPDFNSPFTTPVLLDSLDPATANKAGCPVIACQNNDTDNDSANLTELVLFQKYQPASQNFNIAGVFNKKAATSAVFSPFSINTTANNVLQPDVTFNPFDSTFIVTCFDSTDQKLPYYLHEYNMTDPDAWGGLSAGYNDTGNLVAPHPQVAMDFRKRTGVNVWCGKRENGNGAAMFDSPYIWYVGTPENPGDPTNQTLKIYPNPASEFATLEFESAKYENAEIKLVNSMGQSFPVRNNYSMTAGENKLRVDISGYAPGIYMVVIRSENCLLSGKVAVAR